ncbi:MAG: SRPBCC family protein [Pseudomonadota bacterium]
MRRDTETALVKELLGLKAEKSAFLEDGVPPSPVRIYTDQAHFDAERVDLMRKLPLPAAHSSELDQANGFLTRQLAGLPLLLTRDAHGHAHAFLNVCRHRGTRLVDDAAGCRARFTCPYHAWTWNNEGELKSVPHEGLGFPDLDRDQFQLVRLGCLERYGWLWVTSDGETPDVDAFLGDLVADFEGLDAANHRVVHTDVEERDLNWKILIEGGLEAYHFRVAHRKTIGPFFEDNLSSYRTIGPHLRSILARRTMPDLAETPENTWRLRDHAQVLYTIMPTTQLLVQSDHIACLQLEPLGPGRTRIRSSTLAPADRLESDDDIEHWVKNHTILMDTIREDFTIGESIQSGLNSGANQQLTFGRFEGALAAFNRLVAEQMAG